MGPKANTKILLSSFEFFLFLLQLINHAADPQGMYDVFDDMKMFSCLYKCRKIVLFCRLSGLWGGEFFSCV